MAAITATRVALTLGQVVQKKYPGGIWGFVGSLFLVGVFVIIGVVSLLQALISAIPNWEDSCGTGSSESADDLNVPAGSLIFPMAKGTAVPTSPYGPRWGRNHNGQDWGAPHGTPMYAIADGKVLFAGPASGFGQSIWITHEINGKTWTSQYGHMPSATKYVKTGDTVKVGQKIAVVGSEGFSTGPHLHFQIHNKATKVGGTVDPMKWLKDRNAKEMVKGSGGGGGNTAVNIRTTSFVSGIVGIISKDLVPSISKISNNVWANQGFINVAVLSKYSGLNKEQQKNAKTIIAAGKAAEVNSWGWTIALATAMQESTMNNINYGDRDSLGLFQQRPGTGWGTAAEITNPYKSAEAFYGTAKHTNNPGLKDIKGWENMPLTVAAQKVQRSGHPDAYAKWEPLARDIVLQIADEVVAGPGQNGGEGIDCSEEDFGDIEMGECPAKASKKIENVMKASGPGYKAAQPDTLRAARCIYGTFQSRGIEDILGPGQRPNKSDHTEGKAADVMIPKWNTPKGKKLGDAVAAFAIKYQKELGVTYIIWDVKIINVARGETKWRDYTHPNGNANPTVRHEDHVHISFKGNGGTGIKDGIDEQPNDHPRDAPKAV